MIRKGAAKGSGSGYKNLRGFPKDPLVHSQSAHGMKQPQRINIFMARSEAAERKKRLAFIKKHAPKRYQEAVRKGQLSGKAPKKFDEVAAIMEYEGGNPSQREVLELFSHLIKNGHAWTLQGMYGRQAARFIEAGIIDRQGNINWQNVENADEGYYEPEQTPARVQQERTKRKHELVKGGLADGKPDSAFNETELKKGINVEMEHTDDPKVAKEIAKDHLTEDTEYYKKLAVMEAGDTPTTPSFAPNFNREDMVRRRELREERREMRAERGQHTNSSIGQAFFSGRTRGRSNHMEIVDTPTETLLVGYGWAVYGARNKATGRTTYYSGWNGYSVTTSKQLRVAGIRGADRIVPERRQL